MNGILQMQSKTPARLNKLVRLMIVEDDKHYFAYLQAFLLKSLDPTFELFVFPRLDAAMAEVSEIDPDIILLDLNLPDSYGLQTLQSMLQVSGTTPILVLTANEEDSTGLEAVRMGAQDFLIKQRVKHESLRRCILYTVERKKAEEYKQRQAAIKDFVGTLAHDLSVPMIGSQAVFEALLNNVVGELSSSQMELVHALRNSNTKQLALVKKLIEVYKYESDTEKLVMQEVSIHDVLRKSVELFKDNTTTRFHFSEKVALAPVIGNTEALEQLLFNLLDNASKYREPDSEVHIDADRADNHVIIRIINKGPQLPAEISSGRFQSFWRSIPGQRYIARTGLGLYLCHRILSLHQGKLTCSSSKNTNTITVFLPISETTHIGC